MAIVAVDGASPNADARHDLHESFVARPLPGQIIYRFHTAPADHVFCITAQWCKRPACKTLETVDTLKAQPAHDFPAPLTAIKLAASMFESRCT